MDECALAHMQVVMVMMVWMVVRMVGRRMMLVVRSVHHLLHARYSSACFAWVNSFNSHKNPSSLLLLLSPFYR